MRKLSAVYYKGQRMYLLPIANMKNSWDFVQQDNKFFWEACLTEVHKCPVPIVIVVCAKFLYEKKKFFLLEIHEA